MDTVVATYIIYLLVSVALTVWVGRTLYSNGAQFLIDVFDGNKDLAAAVNHLLVVGFYLINFGFVSLSLKISDPPTSVQASFEALSVKVGAVLVVLGLLHVMNVYVFNRIRSRAKTESRLSEPLPPVTPDTGLPGWIAPQPPTA